jgi:DNA-directed RNA polymerase specialized sigma24 family protein
MAGAVLRAQTTPKKPLQSSSPPAQDALLKALSAQPDATAADLAAAASLGRSTASKTLARLEQAGQVRRREGGRRLHVLLSQLPEEQREVITLVFYGQLSTPPTGRHRRVAACAWASTSSVRTWKRLLRG